MMVSDLSRINLIPFFIEDHDCLRWTRLCGPHQSIIIRSICIDYNGTSLIIYLEYFVGYGDTISCADAGVPIYFDLQGHWLDHL